MNEKLKNPNSLFDAEALASHIVIESSTDIKQGKSGSTSSKGKSKMKSSQSGMKESKNESEVSSSASGSMSKTQT